MPVMSSDPARRLGRRSARPPLRRPVIRRSRPPGTAPASVAAARTIAIVTAMVAIVALTIGVAVVAACGGRARPAFAAPHPTPVTQARFRWPLDGHPQVVRRFAPPPRPWLPGHRGVDLAADTGVPVYAAGPGVVRFAGGLAGRGVVSIDHTDGLRTTYEPVTATVNGDQVVRAGDVIGHLEAGHPGCPVAACLHWGLRCGDVYLDPMALVGAAHVRLLPLNGAISDAGPGSGGSPRGRATLDDGAGPGGRAGWACSGARTGLVTGSVVMAAGQRGGSSPVTGVRRRRHPTFKIPSVDAPRRCPGSRYLHSASVAAIKKGSEPDGSTTATV
jgi:murein DD-endopeptidase MepM/ murein hydrolase activator NlpD